MTEERESLSSVARNGLRLRGIQWTVDAKRTEDAHAALDLLEEQLALANELIDDCWHQFAIEGKNGLWPGGLSTLEMIDDYRNLRDGGEWASS